MKGNRAVGVRLEDGKEAFAKTIISDAGIRNTYGKLLPEATRKLVALPRSSTIYLLRSLTFHSTSVSIRPPRSLGSLKTIAGYIQAKTIMLQLITTSPTLITIHYRSLISRFHQRKTRASKPGSLARERLRSSDWPRTNGLLSGKARAGRSVATTMRPLRQNSPSDSWSHC